MNTNYYAKTKRQYKYLIKRLNRLLKTEEWQNLSEVKQNKLKARLSSLFKKLEGAFSSPSLIKAMGTAALVLGLSFSSMAQSFKTPVTNPFSLQSKSFIGTTSFGDLDGDGDFDMLDFDLDMYAYTTGILYYENDGTKTAPNFKTPVSNPYNIITDSIVFKSALADIDNDGDLDLLSGTYYGNHIFYKNSGTKTAPDFDAAVANPFGLTALSEFGFPTFVDLDADGDLDLMVTDYSGNNQYFKNTGSKSIPTFAAPVQNPFGLTSIGYLSSPAFSDIDGDGDYDLMHTSEYGDFLYFENTGSKTNPMFAAVATNPFSLLGIPSGYSAMMSFADLDGDGDDDMMGCDYYGDYYYFENASGIGINENALNSQLKVFPNPTNGIVNVSLGQDLGIAEIEITSLSGQVVKSETIENTNNASLDVSTLKSGVYILKLTADNRVGIKKLIIE